MLLSLPPVARKTRNRTGPAGGGKTHNATATEKGTSFNDANAGISVRVILPVHPSDCKPAQAGRAIIDGVLLVVFLFLRPPRRLHSGLFLTEAVSWGPCQKSHSKKVVVVKILLMFPHPAHPPFGCKHMASDVVRHHCARGCGRRLHVRVGSCGTDGGALVCSPGPRSEAGSWWQSPRGQPRRTRRHTTNEQKLARRRLSTLRPCHAHTTKTPQIHH